MNKKLVAYFSATGTTKSVAETLAQAANADLYEIKPEVLYKSDDLNWHKKSARSTIEMHDKSFRPATADKDANIKQYDTIFIGFPIWWFVAPTIINTFLESYDFKGKKIIVFATSLGSSFEKTVAELKVSVDPSVSIIEGKVFKKKDTKESVVNWFNTLGI